MQIASQEPGEALIVLAPGHEDAWDPMLAATEAAGGRILFSIKPQAAVAALDTAAIETLRERPGVFLVETEAIAGDEAEAFPVELRPVVALWNEHVAQRARQAARAGEGLSWDAPGHLPPDPPPEIQERLRRRELGLE